MKYKMFVCEVFNRAKVLPRCKSGLLGRTHLNFKELHARSLEQPLTHFNHLTTWLECRTAQSTQAIRQTVKW